MSRRSKRRGVPIHGILPVDKPSGPSSFDVVRDVRRHTHAQKTGHAGTLDPLADGVLLVCLGEGTKAVPWLMDAEKEYVTTLALGVETDTLDAQGEITARHPVPALDRATVEAALASFCGPSSPHVIQQVPPAYSALKREGERLYEKARRGEAVDIPARPVTLHDLALEEFGPTSLTLRVRCGKGFYVRSLGRDIGAALGCGAHLTTLRRTETAGFRADDALPLAALLDGDRWRDALVPLGEALGHLPAVTLDEDDARRIWHGNATPWSRDEAPRHRAPPPGPVRLFAPDGQILAIGEVGRPDHAGDGDAGDAGDDDGDDSGRRPVIFVHLGFRTGWEPPPPPTAPVSDGAIRAVAVRQPPQ